MRKGARFILLTALAVLCALASCAPPIGVLRGSGGGGDTTDMLWVVPRRTVYETSPVDNAFRPHADLSVFASARGIVVNVPVNQVTVEIARAPLNGASAPSYQTVPNLPAGSTNGFYRFNTNGRYLARVLYNGAYSEPYSIQVGSMGDGDDYDGEGGIHIVWRPSVTFNSNGGSAVPSQRLEPGGTAVAPPDPTRDGFIFDAWYSDRNLSVRYDFNMTVVISITLYAAWIPAP